MHAFIPKEEGTTIFLPFKTSKNNCDSNRMEKKGHPNKVDATLVAAGFREEITSRIAHLSSSGLLIHKPLIVGFLANSDPSARKYAEWTAKVRRI